MRQAVIGASKKSYDPTGRCSVCRWKLTNPCFKVSKVKRETSNNVFRKAIFWKVKRSVLVCRHCWADYLKI